MNQQYGTFPPPPTQLYSARRQYAERTPPILPTLNRAPRATQNVTGSGSPLSTPLSPVFSLIGSNHSSISNSAMAARAYNPQQWGQTNPAGGSHMAFSSSQRNAREVTGMEAMMPSPPPPYTPPPDSASRIMRQSPAIGGNGFVSSPLSAETSMAGPSSQRSTPPGGPAAHFPPPPIAQGRDRSVPSTHRDPQRSRFSLTGLAARVKRSDSSEQMTDLGSSHMPPAAMAAGLVPRAPSSRRAASTGAIGIVQPSGTGRTSPDSAPWEPGMPLPPPPPGPPPVGSRSQSLNRYANCTLETQNSAPAQQPIHQSARRKHESTLGAIPPTPSDWVPENEPQPSGYQELRIDTGRATESAPRGSSLTRRPAAKEPRTDSIRARRSRSRANKEVQESSQSESLAEQTGPSNVLSDSAKPSDLILSPADGLLRRRRAAAAEASSSHSSPIYSTSPGQLRRQAHGRNASMLTPPYTPATAAPRQKDGLLVSTSKTIPGYTESNMRPLSHILHAPIDEPNIGKPLSPQRPGAGSAPTSSILPDFMQSSLDRYREFIQRESSARNDRERLELFASFMVHESRLRRDRYPEAFNAMAGDIMDLTRDMWRPLPVGFEMHSFVPASRNPSSENVDTPFELDSGFQTSASSVAELTPATDTESLADDTEQTLERRPPAPWGDKFQPCLSPIPSMAVSTVPEEESSRGRSASRWWEESADGSSGNGSHRLERTRQETKYMSLHPQELFVNVEPSPNQSTPTPGTCKQTFNYGPDEYPPEKVGWHEEAAGAPFATPPPHSAGLLSPRSKAPVGRPSDRAALDVSRLVTLPPSYPRHYPAVKNDHPALGTLRANHRAVADLSDIHAIIQAHESVEASRRQAWQASADERLRRFLNETQQSIDSGNISYNDATQAERVFQHSEAAKVFSQAETQSQEFRQHVAEPVHQMLLEHLRNCNNSISQLINMLDTEAQSDQSMLAQTEGDERPELVEQLTLLKWLFESRERIYKERFDVETALIGRQSAAVLTRYRQARDKIHVQRVEQQLGFERQERQLQYAKEAKERFEQLGETVEKHVTRGVEIQLSAFWDIAPDLVEVVQKVPRDLHGFEILVPSDELLENGTYHDFPLQYMFTILNHARRSAYQFIEAQTNLLCLLHEVHTAAESASRRLTEIKRTIAGEETGKVQAEMAELSKQREQELTYDLQAKVGEVEGQWRDALGSTIEDCIARIKMWLQEIGGWDQSLESLEV